jgi:predicted Zn-dependent protease
MAAGRYAEAVPVYRDLVKAVPGNPGLVLNLGMALHLAGQDQEALPHPPGRATAPVENPGAGPARPAVSRGKW